MFRAYIRGLSLEDRQFLEGLKVKVSRMVNEWEG
jgi:hypothetical protein